MQAGARTRYKDHRNELSSFAPNAATRFSYECSRFFGIIRVGSHGVGPGDSMPGSRIGSGLSDGGQVSVDWAGSDAMGSGRVDHVGC